jgi:hypothetical protein
MAVIVHIGAADAPGFDCNRDLTGTHRLGFSLIDAQFVRRVNGHDLHRLSRSTLRDGEGGTDR